MALQNQTNIQRQDGSDLFNNSNPRVFSQPPPLVTEENPCNILESYVNEKFKLVPVNSNVDCSPVHNVGNCIFSFTKSCTPNVDIIIGGKCREHNRALQSMVPLKMNLGELVLCHVSTIQIANGDVKPFSLLTSMLPIGASPSHIEALLRHADISGKHKDMICKFLSELAQPIGMHVNTKHLLIMNQVVNLIVSDYIPTLSQSYQKMKNVLIECVFTKGFEDTLRTNKWFVDIDKKVTDKKIMQKSEGESQNLRILYIPLLEFNMIDILALSAYYMDVGVNKTGYAANIQIVDGQFVHGVGQGIYNAIKMPNSNLAMCAFGAYPEDVARVLESRKDPLVTNLDPLVLTALPAHEFSLQESTVMHPFIVLNNNEQGHAIMNHRDMQDIMKITHKL